MVRPVEFETFSDRIVLEDEDSEAGQPTGLGNMEVEAGQEKFGVAEIKEVSEVEVGTDTSSEDKGQSDWSLEEC